MDRYQVNRIFQVQIDHSMKRFIKTIEKARETVLGINDRNLSYVYPYNPRTHFRIANDKSLSKKLFADNGIPVPKTYALIENFRQIDNKINDLTERPSFVIKPAMGSMGQGILILKKTGENSWITPVGEEFGLEKLKLHVASVLYGAFSAGNSDKVLIEYCLNPEPVLQQIFANGIPDLRILVFKDKPFMAMMRIPTNVSKGKANLHQGAIGVGVEMKTGKLLEGYHRNRHIDKHPDSGNKFTGIPLPHWEKTIEIACQTASLVPLKYLGVDIILDRDLGPLVIEINARPGLQIQNANKTGLKELFNQST